MLPTRQASVLRSFLISDNRLCTHREEYCIPTPILQLPIAAIWDLCVLSVVRRYQPKETSKYILKLTGQRESMVVTSAAECKYCCFIIYDKTNFEILHCLVYGRCMKSVFGLCHAKSTQLTPQPPLIYMKTAELLGTLDVSIHTNFEQSNWNSFKKWIAVHSRFLCLWIRSQVGKN